MCNQKSNLINRAEAPRTVFFHGVDGGVPTRPRDEKPTPDASAIAWSQEAQVIREQQVKALTGRVFCK